MTWDRVQSLVNRSVTDSQRFGEEGGANIGESELRGALGTRIDTRERGVLQAALSNPGLSEASRATINRLLGSMPATDEVARGWVDRGRGALIGGVSGAVVGGAGGSVIPGLGTGLGALAGGVVGLAIGLREGPTD